MKNYAEKDAISYFESAKVVYKNEASNYLRHFCNKILELRATIGTEELMEVLEKGDCIEENTIKEISDKLKGAVE